MATRLHSPLASLAHLPAVGKILILVPYLLGSGAAVAQRFTESTLPILLIDAARWEIPDEPKVLTRMRLIDNAPGVVNHTDDVPRGYNGYVGIERRGSTSQDLFPKVGYKLELRTRSGADTSAQLLGMPEESDWVLHGPYSDKTLIRNAFTYTLAARLGDYAPRTRMVEVKLGSDYVGVYALVESIKRDKNRVDISKLGPAEISGDELTGGYIVKADKYTSEDPANDPTFELPARGLGGQERTTLLYHYPKPGDIVPEQRAYIKSWLTEFEARLAGADYEDATKGYAPLIDERSFVDFLLINEITRNVDGYRLSTYAYKEKDSKGGRLHMGPVWDFNLAIANADYCEGSKPEGWMFNFEEYCPNDGFQPPFWYTRLWTSYQFRAATAVRWRTLRGSGGALSDAALYGLYDSLAAVVSGEPARRNFERWPVLGQYTWPNAYVPTSHADALAFAKTFLSQRVAWLDGQFAMISAVADVNSDQLRLYPNPGQGGPVQMGGLPDEAYPARILWYDMTGRVVADQRLQANASIDAPENAGVYVFRVESAGGTTYAGKWVNAAR